jgi:hypothetical protein
MLEARDTGNLHFVMNQQKNLRENLQTRTVLLLNM